MSSITENWREIRQSLPQNATLVAVSKYHPINELEEVYKAGQRVFGENLVQELRMKQEAMPKDIQWHFIGHLQKNKVKYIAPFVSLIHSVDSIELLREINRQAAKCDRTIPCLLQLHVASEETKFGFTPEECIRMLEQNEWKDLSCIHISGIMGMATNTPDTTRIKHEFQVLRKFFDQTKETYFPYDEQFSICSWGMSSDYKTALQEGSNMVRIGSKIFGARPPKTTQTN